MKVIVTGGHITPALAVIEELLSRRDPHCEIFFAGRKTISSSDRSLSYEYLELQRYKIPFFNLQSGRLTRLWSWRLISEIGLLFQGVLQSWQIINLIRPDCVMSFGGYLALPVAFIAWIRRIPIYTHEQTLVPGLANRLIARWAKVIFVAFPQVAVKFPRHKVIVSGNPLRPQVLREIKNPFPKLPEGFPVIYITGGSLGAHSINRVVGQALALLLQRFIVIHQSGDTKQYDDYAWLQSLRRRLPKNLQLHYFLKKHFSLDEIGSVYKQATAVVSRAGANTVFELLTLNKPALLIPLPWSAGDEQRQQALLLAEKGKAVVIEQHNLNSESLIKAIDSVLILAQTAEKTNNLEGDPAGYQYAQTIIADTLAS